MKKFSILLSLCLLVVSLAACGRSENKMEKTKEAFDIETNPVVAKEDREIIIDSGIAMGIILENGDPSGILNQIKDGGLRTSCIN